MRLFLVFGLLAIGALAHAGSVATYEEGHTTTFVAGATAGDSAAISVTTSLVETGHNQVVRVDAKFSVASATCKVHFIRTDGASRCSMSTTTATADPTYTFGGLFVADSIAFDTGTYKYCKLVYEAPSSGNVTLDLTVCGPR